VIRRLQELGHDVTVHDPLADPAEAMHEYGVELATDGLTGRYDMVVVAVPHAIYGRLQDEQIGGLLAGGGLLADLKNLYSSRPLPAGADRWTL
jgi:UDP-N-acetyl-D-galactosamine dehydrogenase